MRSKGESRDKRMIRICLPVANQINKDLEFTAEAAEEFKTGDFQPWILNYGWKETRFTITTSRKK